MGNLKRKLSKFLVSTLVASFLIQSGVPVYATTVQEQEGNTKTFENSAEQDDVIDGDEGGIALFSLLPIEERSAYLLLNEYSEEQLKEMPLETVLSLIKGSDGNPIEIPSDAEIVWAYFKDQDGNVLYDVYHEIGRDTKVDLTQYRYTRNYTMELIVGSGNQLDTGNIRYIVKVYISDTLSESISYNLAVENSNGRRIRVYPDEIISTSSSILEDIDLPVTVVSCVTSSHEEGNIYYLGINSMLASNQKDIKVDIYPMQEFLKYYQNGNSLSGAITDQILNQGNVSNNGGYQGTYTESPDVDADNIFCIVYSNAETGDVIAYQGLVFIVCGEALNVSGKIYTYEAGRMKDITKSESINETSTTSWQIKLGEETNGVNATYNLSKSGSYTLEEGYSSDAEYYYILEENEHIEKVVLGSYNTLESAERAEDITEQVLPIDRSEVPCGYRANYDNGRVYFTIFYDDGTVLKYNVYVNRSTYTVEYDDAPVVNSRDPYFQVNGAVGYNRYSNIYVVENEYQSTIDTLYGYGYQTVFINDESADLEHLKPQFYLPANVKAYVGEEQISGESEQDFSNGSVYYSVFVDDNQKNYNVTFAKKESGAKLFVNGPDRREIFLDEYFENRHDILIANIGDEELTGLNVELQNAVHVKLDDYWIVGGENNDTLAAFDEVWSSTTYGELFNLAKIRLLPDGEGEISGTLKISADGQEDVYIDLTGHAGNPKIITERLSDAVKYVPYSYVVATDNMHDWNKVTFEIAEGTLPDGLELNPSTGEIYGVPLETGDFSIKVEADYSRTEFMPSYADLTLTVKENTNVNVYTASDAGYELEAHIGTETATGTYDYLLADISDQLFVSSGEYAEFIDFWLNGERLVDGVDYEKESGSTRITIRSQTFRDKAQDGVNTIAAEFRVDGDETKELKRTAQNFRIYLGESEPSDGDSDSNNDDNPSDDGNSSENNSESDRSDNNEDRLSSSENSESIGSENNSTSLSDSSWIKNDIGWWYKLPDGSWLVNTWLQLSYGEMTEWYYFNEQGYMVTGWLLYKDQWYYLNPLSDGTQGKMCIGWQLIDGKWYYFNEDGALMTNTWLQLPYEETTEWYYFNAEGAMATGWLLEHAEWYYLNPVSDGTQGKMCIGWRLIDGKWYYFNEVSDGTKGVLITNNWVGDWYVDENGAWVE